MGKLNLMSAAGSKSVKSFTWCCFPWISGVILLICITYLGLSGGIQKLSVTQDFLHVSRCPANSPNVTTHPAPLSPTKVLMITHYRGGSSFLGELFNQNSEAMYWFEPLHGLEVRNPFSRGFLSQEFNKLSVDEVLHILTCKLDMVLEDIITDGFVRAFSNHSPSYRECVKTFGKRSLQCVPFLKTECLTAKIIAVKAIRLRMKTVTKLLDLDASVKVVLYLRDPRAMMLSRNDIHNFTTLEGLSVAARNMCAEIENDLEHFQALRSLYPTNLLLLQYEDLVLHQNKTIDKLYKFIGAHAPTTLYEWLEKNTKAKKPGLQYGTRRNSTYVLNRWKSVITHGQKDAIDKVCSNVLKQLHYC